MSREINDAARLCHVFSLSAKSSDSPCIAFDQAFSEDGGLGASIGLIDGTVDMMSPDLEGADILTCDFVGSPDMSPDTVFHGTSMATLLVGQGRQYMRGVVPRAQLLAARAVGPGDVATPARVAAAIDWLVSEGIRIVALPLGSETEAPAVDAAIARGVAVGVCFFAASGSGAGAVLYPARHPAVIAVGAADDQGHPIADARHKPPSDLLAPGWKIPGLSANGATCNGSSIACVLAAGVAAQQLGPIPQLGTGKGSDSLRSRLPVDASERSGTDHDDAISG